MRRTRKDSNPDPATVVLPAGIWQRFHFGDPHPDLPLLYLQGGRILPCGPVIQSVEEATPKQPLTLLLAMDESGEDRWRSPRTWESAANRGRWGSEQYLYATSA